jgi:hypothetical protein
VLALASDDDYRGDCTEDEFVAVARHIVRDAVSLRVLMDDLVDPRVVSYLARDAAL